MNAEHLPVALLLSAGWVAFAVAAHFAIFHLTRVERRARTLVAVFSAALMGYLWTSRVFEVDRWRIAYGLVVLFCAFILYMPFYYTVAASQSVQMLIDIRSLPEGLSAEELGRGYGTGEVLAERLATLVTAGYLESSGEQYSLTAKGRAVARTFRAVKAVWKLSSGG